MRRLAASGQLIDGKGCLSATARHGANGGQGCRRAARRRRRYGSTSRNGTGSAALLSGRDEAVELRAKSGKPLGRYFPELVAMLQQFPAQRFVVDGEIVIEVDGASSFDALQMRLHPAESRIRKLAAETPARLILFDMLAGADGRMPAGRTAHQQAGTARGVRHVGRAPRIWSCHVPRATSTRRSAG